MPYVKKINGKWMVMLVGRGNRKSYRFPIRNLDYTRNWWGVRQTSLSSGAVKLGNLIFPEELIGEKVRFIVEVIDNKKVIESRKK